MNDIVERLRSASKHPLNQHGPNEWLAEAADLITALRAENEKLRAAATAIIDFHNGPLEAKRPDIFYRLIVKLNAALENTDGK